MSAIPQSLQSQISPEQLARFRELATNQDRPSNEATVLQLLKDPSLVVPGTIENYQGLLSKADYRRFYADAYTAPSPAKVLAANLDEDQLKSTILQNPGLKGLVEPKPDTPDFTTAINLRTSIRDQIDAEQTRTGAQLTREGKQKIMDQTIMNTV
jgi:hypothetical protein